MASTLGQVIRRELLRRWHQLNKRYVDGRLQAPVFAFDQQATTRLGQWVPSTRTLHLSWNHVSSSTWVEVELTLRHEMAHQVVSEIFEQEEATAHGLLFQRACRMLRLDHSPRRERDVDNQAAGVLRRVRKLLRLSESDNIHEAQTAMAHANRLLLQYNLKLADTAQTDFEFRYLGTPKSRIPLEQKVLAAILKDHFFVDVMWIGTTAVVSDKPTTILEVFGRSHSLEIAGYAHEYVNHMLDLLWDRYRRTLPSGAARRARKDYRVGMVQGFRTTLNAARERNTEAGLVWMGDPAAQALFRERHTNVSTLRGSTYRLSKAHSAGVDAGRNLRLRAGINESPAQRGRLITAE